jgi:hypothetical protein
MATKRHESLILSLKSEALDLDAARAERAFSLHAADLPIEDHSDTDFRTAFDS